MGVRPIRRIIDPPKDVPLRLRGQALRYVFSIAQQKHQLLLTEAEIAESLDRFLAPKQVTITARVRRWLIDWLGLEIRRWSEIISYIDQLNHRTPLPQTTYQQLVDLMGLSATNTHRVELIDGRQIAFDPVSRFVAIQDGIVFSLDDLPKTQREQLREAALARRSMLVISSNAMYARLVARLLAETSAPGERLAIITDRIEIDSPFQFPVDVTAETLTSLEFDRSYEEDVRASPLVWERSKAITTFAALHAQNSEMAIDLLKVIAPIDSVFDMVVQLGSSPPNIIDITGLRQPAPKTSFHPAIYDQTAYSLFVNSDGMGFIEQKGLKEEAIYIKDVANFIQTLGNERDYSDMQSIFQVGNWSLIQQLSEMPEAYELASKLQDGRKVLFCGIPNLYRSCLLYSIRKHIDLVHTLYALDIRSAFYVRQIGSDAIVPSIPPGFGLLLDLYSRSGDVSLEQHKFDIIYQFERGEGRTIELRIREGN